MCVCVCVSRLFKLAFYSNAIRILYNINIDEYYKRKCELQCLLEVMYIYLVSLLS